MELCGLGYTRCREIEANLRGNGKEKKRIAIVAAMPFSANVHVPNLPIGGFGSRDLPKLKVKQRKKFRARKQKSNKKDRMIFTPHTATP